MKDRRATSARTLPLLICCTVLAGCSALPLAAASAQPAPTLARESALLIKDGDKVAFLGDSITAGGASYGGYCRLVEHGLKTRGIEIEPVLAGIPGNTSEHMLARLDDDVLRYRPDWVVVAAGVNDIWHGDPTVKIGVFQPKPGMGVKLDAYEENLTAIVNRCTDAGARVILTTITPIREDPEFKLNLTARRYNDFLMQLAKERNLPIADLHGVLFAEIAEGVRLTSDGVHPLVNGHRAMAKGLLQAVGFPRSETEALEKEWSHSPSVLILGDRQTTAGSRTGGWIHLLLDGLNRGHEMVTAQACAQYRKKMTVSVLLDGLTKNRTQQTRCVILQAPRGDAELATPLDQYREAIEQLIDFAKANNMKLVLTTIAIAHNNPTTDLNRTFESYNEVLREVSRARRIPLADINHAMAAAYAKDPAVHLTFDGERFNRAGSVLMVESIMQAMGLETLITPRLRKTWADKPAYFRK